MKLKSGMAILLASAAALALPSGAGAQDARDLDNASSDVRIFTGQITSSPLVYSYTMAPGTSLRVDVIPTRDSDLDPVVSITNSQTGDILAEDDDGGEGLASRANIHSADGQRIEITVSAYRFFDDEDSGGGFELQLRPSIYYPPVTRSIGFGSDLEDTLAEDAEHLFVISGEEGQLLEVALVARGDELDPTLSLYQGTDTFGEPAAFNDDGGEGLNSLLRFLIPETGEYTLVVRPYSSTSGDYTLRVAEARYPVLQAPVQMLGLGERMTGRVGAGYESGSLEPSEITYRLAPEAIAAIRGGVGDVTINMTGPEFSDQDFGGGIDSLLEVGFETPIGFASMMTNDDGGEGLNSRIVIDAAALAEGDWLERLEIRASALGLGGDFEIEMVEGRQEVEAGYGYGDGLAPPPIRIAPPAPVMPSN